MMVKKLRAAPRQSPLQVEQKTDDTTRSSAI